MVRFDNGRVLINKNVLGAGQTSEQRLLFSMSVYHLTHCSLFAVTTLQAVRPQQTNELGSGTVGTNLRLVSAVSAVNRVGVRDLMK
jgi:hypothetical protein